MEISPTVFAFKKTRKGILFWCFLGPVTPLHSGRRRRCLVSRFSAFAYRLSEISRINPPNTPRRPRDSQSPAAWSPMKWTRSRDSQNAASERRRCGIGEPNRAVTSEAHIQLAGCQLPDNKHSYIVQYKHIREMWPVIISGFKRTIIETLGIWGKISWRPKPIPHLLCLITATNLAHSFGIVYVQWLLQQLSW